MESGERRVFRARKLFLCLGALNTARLVLRANNDIASRLPLVETPSGMRRSYRSTDRNAP